MNKPIDQLKREELVQLLEEIRTGKKTFKSNVYKYEAGQYHIHNTGSWQAIPAPGITENDTVLCYDSDAPGDVKGNVFGISSPATMRAHMEACRCTQDEINSQLAGLPDLDSFADEIMKAMKN